MKDPKSFDKIAKLLDLLDKHIEEENCRHSPNDLLKDMKIIN